MKSVLSVALLGGLVAFAALPAFSDSDNSAVITEDFACFVYNGDGNLELADGATVQIDTHGGQTIFRCQGNVSNTTGSAVIWRDGDAGKGCNTFQGPSDQWQNTVSESGNATLVCRVSD